LGQRYLNIHLHRGCWWRDNGSTSAHSFLIRGRDVGTQAVNKGDNILGMKDTLFLATDGSVGTLFSKDVGRCVLTGGYGRRIWIKVEWRAGN